MPVAMLPTKTEVVLTSRTNPGGADDGGGLVSTPVI